MDTVDTVFINREVEREVFHQMLRFEDNARLLTFMDSGGRGKSFLLKQLQYECNFIYDIPAMRTAQVAAVVAGLIPSGLFAMVIVAYALGAVRMAEEGALAQQTNAVESMSNVEVLCSDKTGTLTANRIVYEAVHPLNMDQATVEGWLGVCANSASSRST